MSDLPTHALWVDIETDGVGTPWHGHMLEMAWEITPLDLSERGLAFGDWFINSDENVQTIREGAAANVQEMHDRNGLWIDLAGAKIRNDPNLMYPREADTELCEIIGQHTDGRIALAGSGVQGFDRKWLAYYFPRTTAKLTYWALDVGVVRRLVLIAGGEAPPEGGNHRARTDVERAISQTYHFLRNVRKGEPEGGRWL